MSIEWIRGEGYYSNSYFSDGILFDAGMFPMSFEKFKDEIETIVLTHCHFDHIAHVKEAAYMSGAEVCIHEADAKGLNDDSKSLSIQFSARSPGIVPDRILQEGETIGPFEVIHTPGHTPGCICLYNRDTKDLVSGDTVFTDGGFGRFDFPGGSINQLKESIKKLSLLDVEGLYPGHGLPVINNGNLHIKAALRSIEMSYI
ncbi:MBL fold metallo-hydrolase [Methanomicrobium antiquum]|uniref:MBL fold metallo-hydrolase n=1 Tax=Methanomicrobium antiquum TaxID=487686 RepID=A0AAF0FM02_9EURY|nr:MBL fold metallo-hydrolase [Methanomicrobium antiquum]WFN36330.1 MBL fold metallo-hydrolase [Methanomicrobium antiquum]